MDNLEWFYLKTTFDIAISSFFLLTIKLVLGTSTLKYKTFGVAETSGHVKCGLSWIVLKLLLNLVAEKI